MSCDTADTQITTTSNGGCKNRSRIDMEIRPKQQDTALYLLVKTLRFSHACAAREPLLVAQHLSRHSAWLRDIPAHCHSQGSSTSPTLPPRCCKNLLPLNPSSARSSTAQPHGTSMENTASPPLQPAENSSRSTFPAGEGREQPDAVLEPTESLWEWGDWGRDGGWRQGCTMVWLCGAGGCPRHWESYSMILFLLLSCATTRHSCAAPASQGDPGGQNTPARFPLPHPINLPFREKSQPFISQGR